MIRWYILSSSFEQLANGIQNKKRLKLCFLVSFLLWICAFYHSLGLISYQLWSSFYSPKFSVYANQVVLILVILLSMSAYMKIELSSQEVQFANVIKIFYFIQINDKSKHKLTLKNYKKLSIWSRLFMFMFINIGATAISILWILFLLYFLDFNQLNHQIHLILTLPIYLSSIVTQTLVVWMFFILLIFINLDLIKLI